MDEMALSLSIQMYLHLTLTSHVVSFLTKLIKKLSTKYGHYLVDKILVKIWSLLAQKLQNFQNPVGDTTMITSKNQLDFSFSL